MTIRASETSCPNCEVDAIVDAPEVCTNTARQPLDDMPRMPEAIRFVNVERTEGLGDIPPPNARFADASKLTSNIRAR